MKVRIGNRLVEAEMKNGKPVIKAITEEIKRPDGRVDIVVRIPCLNIQAKREE